MSRRGNREGSIYKHKATGLWCAQVHLGYDAQGKPVRQYVYGKTRQEVSEKMAKLLPQVNAGLISPERYSLGDWLYTWLYTYKKNTLRPTTFERYESLVRKHVVPALGKIALEKLRPEILQRFYLEKQKGLSSRSVEFIHAVLHGAMKKALQLGYISRNVCDCVEPPRKKQKEIRILTREELERFLFCARKHRLYPAFLLLATTGLRRGELLGLRWQDVDLDRGVITVSQALAVLSKKLVFLPPKTKAGKRMIPLLPEVVEELRGWKKKWLEEKIALGPDWPETDLVFPSEVHTPIYPRNFLRVFRDICESAGISGITIHGLRHSFASYLLASGENPKIVQELLGHSSISLTLDTYSKVLPGLKEQAIEKLRGFLNGVFE
ncbi:MAG: site-specific integrase [Candidatus Atribacteria bacterium]|nr:site-specific integrase [Candidatus Atribacteria bacterium]